MNLVWLLEARDDIQRLYDFLLERDPEAAKRAVRAIQVGAKSLIEHPRAGRALDDETGRRELFVPFGAAAYVLRYFLLDDRIVVVRVWHSREKRV
jgi:plasmid stabilization system protein ParE